MFIENDEDRQHDTSEDESADTDDTAADATTDADADDTEGDGESVTMTKAELEERDRKIRKDQDKRWKDRMRNASKDEDDDADDSEDDKGDQHQPSKDQERFDRLELKTEGVTDKKQQDVVMDYARFKKISVQDALNTPAVKAELKAIRDKASTPPPSRRTGGGAHTDDVSYWVEQFHKGRSAPTREMRRKVREAIRNGG